MLTDLKDFIAPGFAAYAGTKLLTRLAYKIVQSKFPKLGKHGAAASGLSAFLVIWYFGHKIKKLEKYHDGVVVGSAIAALQLIARTYLPDQYNWIISDFDLAPPPTGHTATSGVALPSYSQTDGLLDDYSDVYEDVQGGTLGVLPEEMPSFGDDADGLGDLDI